jgi:hypothetical protein
MIVRAGKPTDREYSPCSVALASSPNVANLKRIVCNVLETVLLRMLVCKDEKAERESGECPYPEHKNKEAFKFVCNDCGEVLAHVYMRLARSCRDPALRSCIIAFVDGKYLSQTDNLLERLRGTIEWLDIERERPFFRILYYEYPILQVNSGYLCRCINRKIREMFNFYPPEEDVCTIASVMRNSESLIINHNNIFSCRAS